MKYDQFIPSNTVCFKYLVKQYLIIQDKWIGLQALPIYVLFNSIQFNSIYDYCLFPCTHPTSTGPAVIDRPCI